MNYSSPHHHQVVANGGGAVLVDSCLCFIHNFRRYPQLRHIISRHFSPNSLRHSLRLLSFLQQTDPLANTIPNIPDEDLFNAILVRLDQICASAQAPMFAAADLICLPFRPIFAEDDGNLQIEEELRQIRFLLQDWLLQRRSNSHLLLNSAIPSFNLPPTHFATAATSSPEFSTPNHNRPIQHKSLSPHQQYSSSVSPSQSPAKGHRISQVLQKLSTRGKEVEMMEIGGENGKNDEEMAQQQIPSMSATFPPPINSTALAFVATQMQLFQRAAAFAISQQQSKLMKTPEMDVGGRKVGENDDEKETMVEQPLMAESYNAIEMDEENDDGEGAEHNFANADAQSERTTIIGPTKSPTAFSEDGGTSSVNSRGGAEMEEEGGEEKPFFCPLINCQKRFANKFLLKKHQFIHSGQKPHICQFCKKTFNRKDNLLRHKKTHLQNGIAPVEGAKRRHNMLRGISEELAKKMQLLPSNYREGGKGGAAGQSDNGRKSNKATTTTVAKKEAATA